MPNADAEMSRRIFCSSSEDTQERKSSKGLAFMMKVIYCATLNEFMAPLLLNYSIEIPFEEV
jgi:hypothetical protein